MTAPADNTPLIASRGGLYKAMATAQFAQQGYQLQLVSTDKDLAGANKTASNIAMNDANKLVSEVESMGKSMKTAVAVGAVLSMIGGTLLGLAMFGPLSESGFSYALMGGSLAKAGSEEGTKLVTGMGQSREQQIKGKMSIAETAPKIIGEIDSQTSSDAQQDAKALASFAEKIQSFINGQTAASQP